MGFFDGFRKDKVVLPKSGAGRFKSLAERVSIDYSFDGWPRIQASLAKDLRFRMSKRHSWFGLVNYYYVSLANDKAEEEHTVRRLDMLPDDVKIILLYLIEISRKDHVAFLLQQQQSIYEGKRDIRQQAAQLAEKIDNTAAKILLDD